MNKLVPDINPYVPKMGNRVTRFLGRLLLRLLGWRVKGDFPEQNKMIVVAAPHTSNWDFIIAMAGLAGAGVKWSYLMKKEAFFFPFRSLFMSLGGIPVDRSHAEGLVEQVAGEFKKAEQLWLALTPEGTRSKVSGYKTGFLRIAAQAEVPVFIVAWDYASKTVVLDKVWQTTGDMTKDAADIRAYINERFTGRHPKKQ